MRFRPLFLVLLLFLLTLDAHAWQAAEEILGFHSDITVETDGSMLVRETIRVRALGKSIKRGIYRDFPTHYEDRLGNDYRVGFELLETLRDGQVEPNRVEERSNGKRIYLGRKDRLLSPGEYAYTIAYRTNRQLGFFEDHDELYWNVTGNGWGFAIREATATVHLPASIPRERVRLEGYTGPQGARGADFQAGSTAEGDLIFRTTAPLAPQQGLTIVVSWPKGFVHEPTQGERLRYLVEDNRKAAVALGGFLVVFIYYFLVWMRVGRDPAAGAVIPSMEPPQGLSPAALRYLWKMGFDHKAFAASLINMAVKKYLVIEESDGVYTLRRREASDKDLTAEERDAAQHLLGERESIELTNANHRRISAAMKALREGLKPKLEKVYFVTNGVYLLPALGLTVITLVFLVFSAQGEQRAIAGFMSVWLTFWTFAVIFLAAHVFSLWRSALGPGGKLLAKGGAVFMTLFALPFFAGEVFGLWVFASATSYTAVLVLMGLVVTNVLFYQWLKAPTLAGRALLDRVEGFKQFLEASEQQQQALFQSLDRTPATFERLLPYALALDVEQSWGQKFATVLGAAAAAPGGAVRTYDPYWYHGSRPYGWDACGLASALGTSFSSAVSSSSTAPGSSSGGGGGGSSGGGGGGGGGGGW